MARYIRPRVAAATVFFTVTLAHRGGSLLIDRIDLLREAVRLTRARRPFDIDAWVVLPDHMHAVWTLPAGDANFSDRWGAIKARFSREVRREGLGARDRDDAGAVGWKPTLRGEADVDAGVGWKPTLRQDGGGASVDRNPTPPAGRRVGFQPTKPRIGPDGYPPRSPSKIAKQDAGIWQRRFWEHHIRGRQDYDAHVRYCLMNPVKHGLVERPEDWLFSSIHRDMREGRWAA